MKKAIIPMAIAAAFGLVGVIVYSTGTYFPATLTLEGAGGTDEQVETLDDVVSAFSSPALARGSAYYQTLMLMDKDPEPLPEGNSIGVICSGNYDDGHGTSYSRELTIAQNEQGLIYHYDGWQKINGTTTTLDYLMAISRHGMFVKYNKHSIESEKEGNSAEDQLQKDLSTSINKNRGKWIYVGVTEEHMKEVEAAQTTTDPSVYMRAMAVASAEMIATQYQAQFLNVVDTNNAQLLELGQIVAQAKSSAEAEGATYKINQADLYVTVNLSNKTTPVLTLTSPFNSTVKQLQNISLHHINNTKVEIVSQSKGDFVDLFGDAIINYYSNLAD